MYSCDACDRGYASLSARSKHKKKKHNETIPFNVKEEEPAEELHKTPRSGRTGYEFQDGSQK